MLPLYYDKGVYPPNPETQYLIEYAKNYIKIENPQVIIDVGTGSGIIALSIGNEFPNIQIYALDNNELALKNCEKNRGNLHISNVSIVESYYIENIPLTTAPELIIANLPYGSDEYLLQSNIERNLNLIPISALFNSNGLLASYNELISQIISKNWKTTVVIETGVIPKDIVMKELKGRFEKEYIEFPNYSITKIIT